MASDPARRGPFSALNTVFVKCAAVVALSTAIVAALLTWQTATQLGASAREDVAARADSMTRLITQQLQGAVRFGKSDAIAAEFERFIDESDRLATAAVSVDAAGTVLAAVGEADGDLAGLAAEAASSGTARSGADDLVVIYPVTIGPAGDIVGAVAIAWSVEPKLAALAERQRRSAAIAAAAFVLVLGAGIAYVRMSISKPLGRVGAAVQRIAQADYGVTVPAQGRRDEIGAIARDIEGFRASLAAAAEDARIAAYKSAGFEGSSAALTMIDRDGVIRFANPASEALLPRFSGATGTPVGRPVGEVASELADLPALLSAPDRLPVTREMRKGERYVSASVNAVRDTAGDTIGAVIEWKDATADYLNAAVLEAINANQVRAAFGPTGLLVDANDNFRRVARPPKAGEAIGVRDLIDDEEILDAFAAGAGPSAPRFGRFRIAGRDGATAIVSGGFTPVLDAAGKALQFALIGTDITEDEGLLSRAEDERRRLASAQETVVEALRTGLSRLRDGDLTHEIAEAFEPQYETLRQDFNAAARGLHDAVSDVIELAVAMRAEVTEIAGAADDLSRRTEHQAATLEETAAALAEITAAVASAAEGARKANEVVVEARGAATDSSVVVRETVTAMSEISSSSDRISKIIGVIDDIAFQTNLLALNAGVEAARAGDAGRGFAVVASEVRALAQRSSDAAREINELITTSGGHVKRGVSLVGKTGEALEAISASVKNISDNVAEIVVSSQEQSTGLTEVNSSMGQLDQVTQQNAAMFEETSAASQQLVRQADSLSERVARFRVRTARTVAGGTAPNARASSAAVASPGGSPAAPVRLPQPAPPTPARTSGSLAVADRPEDDDWEDF